MCIYIYIYVYIYICIYICMYMCVCACVYVCLGHAAAQLVEALRYKSEGRGFDSRWCHWNFFIDIILPRSETPGKF